MGSIPPGEIVFLFNFESWNGVLAPGEIIFLFKLEAGMVVLAIGSLAIIIISGRDSKAIGTYLP